jgi:DNA invertase Pin-like site-specific DNA recombinase
MQAAIGYLRVTTREQGRSGLGLAPQRFEIEEFGKRDGVSVKSWYQDVQTGAGAGALLLRPRPIRDRQCALGRSDKSGYSI